MGHTPAIPDDAIAAASLILMRERDEGSPELLFIRRASSLVFAAGAYVFPGGRVDPEDHVRADGEFSTASAERAARFAALRETREETGIVVDISIDDLVPFARWLPVHEDIPRRFDTRFYLARSGGRPEPMPDGTESSHAFWATAAGVLARCAAGDGRAIFPTRRLLERLAKFANFDAAREEAERLPPRIISPWIEHRADGDRLCIPEDAGYPVTSELLSVAARY